MADLKSAGLVGARDSDLCYSNGRERRLEVSGELVRRPSASACKVLGNEISHSKLIRALLRNFLHSKSGALSSQRPRLLFLCRFDSVSDAVFGKLLFGGDASQRWHV